MASLTLDSPLQRLRASVIDGRAQNSRFKQKQLQSLYAELKVQADAICEALREDTQNSVSEVETEFYLTMAALRHFYESIDFAQDLKEEYLVTKGIDNPSRRVGAGLVVIRPTTYTRLYSIVVPVAAAIAAGNCVILELEDTLLNLDAGLREALPDALDKETFSLSSERLQDQDLVSCIFVDQTGTHASTAQLVSSLEARAIAIVDRLADVDAAARAIVTARFSFQGMSPYAPDLVIVNEFVKKDFFEACTRYASQSFASQPPASRSAQHPSRVTQKAIKEAEEKGQLSSFGASSFMLVDISERSCPVTNMKIQGRYLSMMTCSSLTDAVSSQDLEATLLAGYFFGDPKTGKFLSQQLSCQISCINQIPIQLLVGPAASTSHAPDFQYRYGIEMFTVSRPQYIKLQPDSVILSLALAGSSIKGPDSYTGKGLTSSSIRKLAMVPLPPLKQRAGSAIGFFEQGLLSGAVTVISISAVVGYFIWIFLWTGAQVAELDRQHAGVLWSLLNGTNESVESDS